MGNKLYNKVYSANTEIKMVDCRFLITGSTGVPLTGSFVGHGVASVTGSSATGITIAFGDMNSSKTQPVLADRDRYAGGVVGFNVFTVQSGSLLQDATSVRGSNFLITRDDLANSGTIEISHRPSGSATQATIVEDSYLRINFMVKNTKPYGNGI